MCFSLAYAGEHYVLDEVAGAAYALVILAVDRRWFEARGLGEPSHLNHREIGG